MNEHKIADSSLPAVVTVGCANFEAVPRDKAASLEKLLRVTREAARQGCVLVVFPELAIHTWETCADCAREHRPCPWHLEESELADGPSSKAVAGLARELDIHVIYGFEERDENDSGVLYNAAAMISPTGVLGTYRKLHLFDIDIPGQVTLKESDHITPGAQPCLVEGTFGPVGLSICYDLRFPELYRHLTTQGARILLCPAAFTLQTGKDHWLPLLRARAIENQCYVIAPGQAGAHGGKRHSYGKSTIIDPWGIPIAIAADGVGSAVARIDFCHQDRIREGLPCAQHRHPFFTGETAA